MCIALLTTAHPDYALILINNRDEYLTRPTAPLSWHPLHPSLLSGRDLLRPAHGTWLGMTTTGHLAVLTNFRGDTTPDLEARSRGEIINAFLTQPPGKYHDTADFVKNLGDLGDVGGFTMVCGKVGKAFGVVSNRTAEGKEERETGVKWVLGDKESETIGVSNGPFGDGTWRKVELGKEMLEGVVKADVSSRAKGDPGGEKVFIEELFGLLSTDTLPKRSVVRSGWNDYLKEFQNSIFIPTVGGEGGAKGKGDGMSGVYGTQKQSIVLVDRKGHVKFVERTLYDDTAQLAGIELRDRLVEFDIEG